MRKTADVKTETIWEEYKRRGRPLIMHLFLWLTVIAGMLIVFVALKVMEAAGFNRDRIELLEDIHFIGDACILVGFSLDMLMNMIAVLFE